MPYFEGFVHQPIGVAAAPAARRDGFVEQSPSHATTGWEAYRRQADRYFRASLALTAVLTAVWLFFVLTGRDGGPAFKGYQVSRKAGWDTHGLPVEIEVEKMLGMKHKDEIVEYGIAQFNAECRKSVWKYKSEWEQMTRMMGYWVDLQDPYVTFENSYMESVWWALKQFYDKGAIFKGYKIQPYCPRCETPLSSHEVSVASQGGHVRERSKVPLPP